MRFRAFRILVAKTVVQDAPLQAVGNLRAQAIHMIVVPVNAHDARAVDRGVENFRRFKVGGNEDAGVESLLRGLCGNGVGEIAGGGAADSGETKSARRRESRGHDTIFERERRKANGVIFEIEILQSPFCGKLARGDQRSAADGIWTNEVFGKREQLGIAPHVEVAAGEVFPAGNFLQRIIVVSNFKRREAIFAERAGDVAPGLAAFSTSQLVKPVSGHNASSFIQAIKNPQSVRATKAARTE